MPDAPKDRTALVVGATGRVGIAVAQALAAEGCGLYLAGLDGAELAGTAKVLREKHPVEVETHAIDLGERVNVDVLALGCDDADILVACAGDGIPEDATHGIGNGWQFKVFGILDLIREMAPAMAEQDHVCSIVIVGMPADSGLATIAANAALSAAARKLAKEYDGGNVRILALDPGPAPVDPAKIADVVLSLARQGGAP